MLWQIFIWKYGNILQLRTLFAFLMLKCCIWKYKKHSLKKCSLSYKFCTFILKFWRFLFNRLRLVSEYCFSTCIFKEVNKFIVLIHFLVLEVKVLNSIWQIFYKPVNFLDFLKQNFEKWIKIRKENSLFKVSWQIWSSG